MINLNQLDEIQAILENSSSIAIAGLSPKPERPSNMVARYLLDAGYSVYPVNPGQSTILNQKCYPDLLSIPAAIDIVNIFRNPEHVIPIVEQAVVIGCSTVWMQLGITHLDAANLARDNSINVIMDRCIKIDHNTLLRN